MSRDGSGRMATLHAAFHRPDTTVYRWVEGAANRRVRRGMVFGDSGLGVRREHYEAAGAGDAAAELVSARIEQAMNQEQWTRLSMRLRRRSVGYPKKSSIFLLQNNALASIRRQRTSSRGDLDVIFQPIVLE